MKLDKYTFARLVAFIGNTYGVTVHEDIMKDIDDIIDVQVTAPAPVNTTAYADASQVDELMRLMFNGTQKIEAIKMYRYLTGKALKESKDAVEMYWVGKSHYQPSPSDHTLGDILGGALKNK